MDAFGFTTGACSKARQMTHWSVDESCTATARSSFLRRRTTAGSRSGKYGWNTATLPISCWGHSLGVRLVVPWERPGQEIPTPRHGSSLGLIVGFGGALLGGAIGKDFPVFNGKVITGDSTRSGPLTPGAGIC